MKKKLLLCAIFIGCLSCSKDPNAFNRKDKESAKIDIEKVITGDVGIVGSHIKSLEKHLAKKNISKKWAKSMRDAIAFANKREDYQSHVRVQKSMDESINLIREQERKRTARESQKSQLPSLNPLELEIGQTYTVLKQIPLMPSHSPNDPIEALKKKKQISKGGAFKVLAVVTKRSNPWYKVTAFDQWRMQIGTGWINSIALFGNAIRKVYPLTEEQKKQQKILDNYDKAKDKDSYNKAMESFKGLK